MIRIAPEIKRSLPWFTGYSFTKFHWNPSITFSTIRLAILNTCPDPGSGLWSASASKRNQIVQTHKISSKSAHNLLRYPAKIKKIRCKFGTWPQNLINSSRPPRLSTHKISSKSTKSVHNFFIYPAKIQKSGVNPVPGSGLWSGSSSKRNQFVQAAAAIDP